MREVLLVLVHRSEQLQRHRQQLFKAAQSQARQKHTACTAQQQQQQQRAAISGVLKQQRDLLVLLDHIITLTHQVRGNKGMTWEGPRA